MKKFKWKVDLSFAPENLRPQDAKAHFEDTLIAAIQGVHPNGIGIKIHRTLNSILEKLQKFEGDVLILEDAEFDLIADTFRKGNFPAGANKMLIQIFNNLDIAERGPDV